MKQRSTVWDTLLLVAVVVLASVCAQAQAQEKNAKETQAKEAHAEEELAVEVAPVGVDDDLDAGPQTRVVEETTFWIGIRGRSIESAVLRTQFQLAADMGVVVEEVVADSPAAKAGLRKHDILLRCNGNSVHDMQLLQDLVRAGKGKTIEMEVIRLGKEEKIVIVPEPLPAELNVHRGVREPGGFRNEALQQMLKLFDARDFGPGVIIRGNPLGHFGVEIPNGVSVSIQSRNDQPAQITVKQGDKTWEIIGDDAKALEQLPADVRPYVERLLNSQQGIQGFILESEDGVLEGELLKLLPGRMGGIRPQPPAPRRPATVPQEGMDQRLERMEKQMQELRKLLKTAQPVK